MQSSIPKRRKEDKVQEDPLIAIYWAIAGIFGHGMAADIISIISEGEERSTSENGQES